MLVCRLPVVFVVDVVVDVAVAVAAAAAVVVVVSYVVVHYLRLDRSTVQRFLLRVANGDR